MYNLHTSTFGNYYKCDIPGGTLRYYVSGRNKGSVIFRNYDDLNHRNDGGPAIIHKTSGTEWLEHGKLHREDGPAHISASGTKFYYINGCHYSRIEFDKKMQNKKELAEAKNDPCNGKIVDIDGKKYKLIYISDEKLKNDN